MNADSASELLFATLPEHRDALRDATRDPR